MCVTSAVAVLKLVSLSPLDPASRNFASHAEIEAMVGIKKLLKNDNSAEINQPNGVLKSKIMKPVDMFNFL